MMLFIDGGSTDLAQYFGLAKVIKYQAAEIICDVESARSNVYMILSGLARVHLLGANGAERLIHYRRPYSFIGDTSSFAPDDLPESLCAVAAVPSEVLRISRQEFRSVLLQRPELALMLLNQAHAKVKSLTNQLHYATFGDTLCQVAALIKALINEPESSSLPKRNRILHLTHQMIAAATGRTRVTVTYTLNRLQDLGAVRLHKGRIEILDLGKLEPFVGWAARKNSVCQTLD